MTRVTVYGANGRMGGLICRLAHDRNDMELTGAVDVDDGTVEGVEVTPPEEAEEAFQRADVSVEFSVPEGTRRAAEAAAATGTPLVTGTTGLSDEVQEAVDKAAESVAVVQSSNYARGVNVFWRVVEVAAELLHGYDFEVTETHHRHKLDAPSGTALTTVERIEKAIGERERVHGREGDAPRGEEIGVHARRAGEIVGEHEVLAAGEGESLEITHRAGDRRAFAGGALDAAVWVADREPGLYGMEDVLGL